MWLAWRLSALIQGVQVKCCVNCLWITTILLYTYSINFKVLGLPSCLIAFTRFFDLKVKVRGLNLKLLRCFVIRLSGPCCLPTHLARWWQHPTSLLWLRVKQNKSIENCYCVWICMPLLHVINFIFSLFSFIFCPDCHPSSSFLFSVPSLPPARQVSWRN